MSSLPLWVLAAVLFGIAFRRFAGLRLAIWQIMGIGALTALASGAIGPLQAWQAIDWEVMGFLFGMFVLGQAMVESGWLAAVSAWVLAPVQSVDALVAALLALAAAGSALLMNDTLAVIGAPLMLRLARDHEVPPDLLLLALAFGVTTGSVLSPIGNPQNLLIALQGGLASPFVDFVTALTLPTLLSLVAAYLVLRLAYWRAFHGRCLARTTASITDPPLARLCVRALQLVLALILLRTGLGLWAPHWAFSLVWIGLAAAAPLLLFAAHPRRLLRDLDWHTLIFFAAMFVLMRSVWDSGALQSGLLPRDWSPASLLLAGVLGSQLISNVPLVALLLPVLDHSDTAALLALAAGATIAGNLSIVGAASNVIIVQSAERRGVQLGFWRFAAVGAPLTLVSGLLYWIWLG